MDATLDRLQSRAEIADLLARYARGIDRCDVDLIKSAYHPGATERHGQFDGLSADFAEMVAPMLDADYAAMQHHITNMLLDIHGDTATGETYFLAFHRQDHDDATSTFEQYGGRYLDTFERRDGRWGIVRRLVVMDWTRIGPLGDRWSGEDTFPLGGRADDPSYAHLTGPRSEPSRA